MNPGDRPYAHYMDTSLGSILLRFVSINSHICCSFTSSLRAVAFSRVIFNDLVGCVMYSS